MLKRSRHPNQYSLKRIEALNAEVPVRLKLIKRCGGVPHHYTQVVHNNGQRYVIKRVACIGGVCEICHKPAIYGERLEPHENPPRSKGTKVSLKYSKMCHRACHRAQHSKPQLEWIKLCSSCGG